MYITQVLEYKCPSSSFHSTDLLYSYSKTLHLESFTPFAVAVSHKTQLSNEAILVLS